jgi:MFS family permease
VHRFLGDRIGVLNSNILFHVITVASCLLIWTFAFSFSPLMGFSAAYGFGCGSYVSLMSPISASILDMDRLPSGLSLLLFFNAFPVFGANIASAIESAVNSEPFFAYKMFTGVAFLLCAAVLFILKLRLNRNPFAKL